MRLVITFLALFFSLPSVGAESQKPAPFQQALPGYDFQFPRDDFSHDKFRIEWWYYTGNLEDEKAVPSAINSLSSGSDLMGPIPSATPLPGKLTISISRI